MSAIIGDAKIKVTLDTEDARKEAAKLQDAGSSGGDASGSSGGDASGGGRSSSAPGKRPRGKADAIFHSLMKDMSNMSLEEVENFNIREYHRSIFNPARTATFAATEGPLGASIRAAVDLYVVKKLADLVEASPMAASVIKGVIGGNSDSPLLNYLSDEITKLKAFVSSFSDAAGEFKDLGRASLRLGQHPTMGGAEDVWSFLRNVDERQDLMNRRVDKEIDKEIFQKLGESIRIAINR